MISLSCFFSIRSSRSQSLFTDSALPSLLPSKPSFHSESSTMLQWFSITKSYNLLGTFPSASRLVCLILTASLTSVAVRSMRLCVNELYTTVRNVKAATTTVAVASVILSPRTGQASVGCSRLLRLLHSLLLTWLISNPRLALHRSVVENP